MRYVKSVLRKSIAPDEPVNQKHSIQNTLIQSYIKEEPREVVVAKKFTSPSVKNKSEHTPTGNYSLRQM